MTYSRRQQFSVGSERPRMFLLVGLQSDHKQNDSKVDFLGIYEACVGGVISTPPASPVTEGEAGENTDDDGDQHGSLIPRWKQFLCPYNGVLRIMADAGLTQTRPQAAGSSQDALSTTPSDFGMEEGACARLFYVLSDPRQGMRSPCTLTIRMGTMEASVSSASPQVNNLSPYTRESSVTASCTLR